NLRLESLLRWIRGMYFQPHLANGDIINRSARDVERKDGGARDNTIAQERLPTSNICAIKQAIGEPGHERLRCDENSRDDGREYQRERHKEQVFHHGQIILST